MADETSVPSVPTSQVTTPMPSILDRAQKIHDETIEAESRIDMKIKEIETKLAEKLLSGKADFIASKSQEEKDQAIADDVVKNIFG